MTYFVFQILLQLFWIFEIHRKHLDNKFSVSSFISKIIPNSGQVLFKISPENNLIEINDHFWNDMYVFQILLPYFDFFSIYGSLKDSDGNKKTKYFYLTLKSSLPYRKSHLKDSVAIWEMKLELFPHRIGLAWILVKNFLPLLNWNVHYIHSGNLLT